MCVCVCLPFSWVIMVIRKAKYMILEFITGVKTQYNNGIACGHKILTNKTTVFEQSREQENGKKAIAHCLQSAAHGRLHALYCCHDARNVFERVYEMSGMNGMREWKTRF